jgi:hypothetical protein
MNPTTLTTRRPVGAALAASGLCCFLFALAAAGQTQAGPRAAQANAGSVPQATGQAPPAADLPKMDFIFEEIVTLGEEIKVGQTPFGGRKIIPITGGSFAGPKLKGRILSGGWDWQLALPDGCSYLKADYMLQTDDGTVINVVNKGALCRQLDAKGERPFTSPVFEAPNGPYEWLNRGAFVGTIEEVRGAASAIRIRFYRAR